MNAALAAKHIYRKCDTCGKNVDRPQSHFSRGETGPLAGLVFCNRECQKRKFRGSVKCAWPGCNVERLIEGPNFRRKQCKAYLCDTHTSQLKQATGHRNITQNRLNWLRDVPIAHRKTGAIFYRWSVLVLNDGKCTECQQPLSLGPDYHADHKRPVSEGGETRLSNMQPLCLPCHKRKSAIEQREVNKRRWAPGARAGRHLTHIEKDRVIEQLRAQLKALGAEPAS